MFSIKTKSEERHVHALIQNIADIPGGVTINASELIAGGILEEGSVIGKDASGVAHVIKGAAVCEAAKANATSIKVKKGSHIKAGDFVTDGNAAVAVASVDSSSSNLYDTITVTLNGSTGLEALTTSSVLEQATAAVASGAALSYEPIAMVAEAYDVRDGENLWVPAVVFGTFKKSLVPPVSDAVLAKLKGIVLL